MSLDVVRNSEPDVDFRAGKSETETVYSKWKYFPISQISHHGKICCEIAREWLASMDLSQLNSGSNLVGPRWINARFKWGPTKWPIHWCEAVQEKELDCGAQSAFAHEVFRRRGIPSFRVQMVQQFSDQSTRQWAERWSAAEASLFWIEQNLIYHECCAIAAGDGELKIWDGSASCWVNPRQYSGYGTVRALRVIDETGDNKFVWGDHHLKGNVWQTLLGLTFPEGASSNLRNLRDLA